MRGQTTAQPVDHKPVPKACYWCDGFAFFRGPNLVCCWKTEEAARAAIAEHVKEDHKGLP